MTISFKQNIFFNVLMPLLLGYFIYGCIYLPAIVKNYLPDGLWSYSLTSILFIIWDGKISLFWTAIVFLVFIMFEFLQHINLINGTGDILDVLTYILFYIIALLLNK
jgi:hypothetical protein